MEMELIPKGVVFDSMWIAPRWYWKRGQQRLNIRKNRWGGMTKERRRLLSDVVWTNMSLCLGFWIFSFIPMSSFKGQFLSPNDSYRSWTLFRSRRRRMYSIVSSQIVAIIILFNKMSVVGKVVLHLVTISFALNFVTVWIWYLQIPTKNLNYFPRAVL